MEKNAKLKLSMVFRRLNIISIFIIIVIFALYISGCDDKSDIGYNSEDSLPPQHSLRWSPDGSMIVFIYDTYVVIQDVETEEQRQLTGTGFYYEPTWSPDSIKIAYSSSSYGARDEIYVKNADGSDVAMRLTRDSAADYRPRWSPDGTKIAFYSSREGNLNIWVKNADGSGDALQLTSDKGSDLNQEWSPDSTKLVFESNRSGNYDLWVVNVDGATPPVQITFSEASDRKPLWSPDGTRIAFQSYRSGEQNIWVKNADGTGDAVEVSAGYGSVSMHIWSPDSRWIAFVSEDREIMLNSSDGVGVAEKVADGLEPCWSPEGDRMAMVSWLEDRYRIQIVDLPEKFR